MKSAKKSAKGVVLYDHFRVLGGAERVTAELVNHFYADLAIGFDNLEGQQLIQHQNIKEFNFNIQAKALPLQRILLIHNFYSKSQFVQNYDWCIYSGNYAPLAVRHQQKGRRILYCHTPPRFMYDLLGYYKNTYSGWKRPLFDSWVKLYQPLYEQAFHSMDSIIANSGNVQRRIKKHLGTEASVIHPPCSVTGKTPREEEGYYLSLARLEPYKRVETIVRAFLRMPHKRLIVASGGSDLERLKILAKNATNIEFTGWVNQYQLDSLISRCIATLYLPIEEDFGMSPVESMAFGKPVIGVAEGGLLETILPEETGILLKPDPEIEDVVEAVERMTPSTARKMSQASQIRAQLFSETEFYRKMDEHVYA